MNIFLLQPGLSEAIVRSQVIRLVNRLNNIKSYNYLMLHISEKSIYGDENKQLIYYDNYLDTIKKCDEKIGFIYTRSYVLFIKLFFFRYFLSKKYKILFDFRGLGSAETYARKKSNIKKYILELVEFFVYKNADFVHSVSLFLKDWLASKWGVREVAVVPCCVEKIILKESKKIPSEMKFVYVGSTSFWQKIESTIHLYKIIESNIENTSLTVITKDKQAVSKLLTDNNIKNYKIKSLSQEEVLLDLVNYDFGFLLRDNILMNNVASPVKFIEYISRGVIPILSEGIGDYSSLVSEKKLGIIVKDNYMDINELYEYYNNNKILIRLYKYSKNYTWDACLHPFLFTNNNNFE